MKIKILLFSTLFILTLWTNKLYGQCDAEFTIINQNVCSNQDTIFINNISTGTGNISCLWQFEDTSSVEFEPKFLGQILGEHYIYLTITDDLGCNNLDSLWVQVNQTPVCTLGPDTTICDGIPVRLFGGYGVNYYWSTGDLDMEAIFVSSPGIYWERFDNGVCENSDTIEVFIGSSTKPNLGSDIEICGDTTLVIYNGPFQKYLWSTNEYTETILVDTSGEYSIAVKNDQNCWNSDTINVVCNILPTIKLATDTTIVQGATIPLTPNSFYGVTPLSDASGIEFSSTAKMISVTNNFSLGIIIKPSIESFDYYGGLITKGNGSNIDSMDFMWFLKPDYTVELQLRNANKQITITSTETLEVDVDYVLLATVSSTGINLYANGNEIANSTETITISDNNGSLNILRSFNEQYNPSLGHCSAKNAVFTGAFIWDTVLNQTDITTWQDNTSILPQSENLVFKLWFKNNKGNTVTNEINSAIGYVYDLKRWKANFPFNTHHNTYNTIAWSIGVNNYGIERLATNSETITVTVTNNLCENSDSINIIVEDSVITNPNQVNIYYQDGTPVDQGFVKVWKIEDKYKTLIDLFDIINGVVSFGDLEAGTYALHIIGIAGYRSFFYKDSHNIQGADLIVLNNGEYIDLNIEIPVNPPNKTTKETIGTVSGYITYSTTGKGSGIYKSETPKGDPVVYGVVELNKISTNPLDITNELTFYQTFMSGISNEIGYFEINGVPLGEYTLYPNITQYDTIDVEPYVIEITTENPIIEDLNYSVDSVAGTGTGTTDINAIEVTNSDIRVYPNPARHYIIIDLANNQDAEIKLYNIIGKQLYQETIYKQKQINLSSNPRGVYLLQIITNNGIHSRKIILE